MSFGPAGATLQVRRARLHRGVAEDRERLRLALDPVRPEAFGMADGALLIVPRIVARKPLRRQGDGRAFAEDVAERLRAALRDARRPNEPSDGRDSLLFPDRTEAAVCLIEQWLAGVPPPRRDWWPHVTAGAEPPVWCRRAILPDGRRLPSVIARLTRRGLAEQWLESLDPGDVRAGLAAIARTHGLSLPTLLQAPVRADLLRAVTPNLAAAAALVEAIAPEAGRSDLPPPARLLLLIGLIAERRPAMLRVRPATLAFAAVAAGNLSRSQPLPDPPRPRDPREPTLPRASSAVVTPVSVETFTAPRRADVATSPEPTARPAPASAFELPPSVAIRSEHGGLLFLLNALLALEVYGDCGAPRRSLPGLSPFGLLRLLGRAWFGTEFVADPLHGLLERLAGGRRADLARDFEARRWSVPPAWLRPWPDPGPALLGGGKRRPMLWHPAGFPLVDLDGGDPRAALRAARRSGLKGRPLRRALPALPAPPRARWLACLRLYLEARVARALGCSGGLEAATLLCRRTAGIRVGGERIEARFALDDHPLAIRMAGLDRDPGWIPAARFDFRYFFE